MSCHYSLGQDISREMSVLGYVLCFVALLDYHVHTVAMIVMHVQVNIST